MRKIQISEFPIFCRCNNNTTHYDEHVRSETTTTTKDPRGRRRGSSHGDLLRGRLWVRRGNSRPPTDRLFTKKSIFRFVSILVVIGSLLAGILFAKWVFECSNGEMLYQWKDYFNPSATTSSRKPEAEEADDDDDDARLDSEKTRRMPWQGLSLPASLNEAVENLLNEIVEQYVNGWYGGAISRDRAFINEIR